MIFLVVLIISKQIYFIPLIALKVADEGIFLNTVMYVNLAVCFQDVSPGFVICALEAPCNTGRIFDAKVRR